jgi:hypothetical protein
MATKDARFTPTIVSPHPEQRNKGFRACVLVEIETDTFQEACIAIEETYKYLPSKLPNVQYWGDVFMRGTVDVERWTNREEEN